MVYEVVNEMCALEHTTHDELSTKRLVARASTESAAFAALYDLNVERVYAYAHRMLGSRPAAEDVTAETFTRALAGIRGFRWRGGGFAAWLLRIARNLCYDELRKESRTTPLVDDDVDHLQAQDPTPDDALADREESARLRELVATLPLGQRETVILKYAAGLGNSEIAELTGRSPSAISSLLNRAMTNLRERYGESHA